MIIPAFVMASDSVGDMVGLLSGEPVANSMPVFAKPKSRILTTPAGVSLMFAGLRSRWMMPRSWAASRPAAICRAMAIASSTQASVREATLQVGALHQFHHRAPYPARLPSRP